MFVHLHVHSCFSLLAGLPDIPSLVSAAKAMGMPALALTDTNRMSGLILFYQECKKQGIQPVLGVELTCPQNPLHSVVVLARNAHGYSDLCELTTQRQLNPKFSLSTALMQPWPHLFFLCHHPSLLQILANGANHPQLYAELLNTGRPSRQQSRNLETLAQQLNIPLIISNNVYFLQRRQFPIHQTLRAIHFNSTVSRLRETEYAPASSFFKSPQQMAYLFPDHAQALQNTISLAQKCIVELPLGNWIMPQISVPTGYTPATYLRLLALRGLRSHYHMHTTYKQARTLQEKELRIINQLGYASYFLMVRELRVWAGTVFSRAYRRPTDCTLMRGSAANSITFYNLGASDLDPVHDDLYFERFLNEERASPPDADLDFAWDEREKALEFFTERFGRDRVAITCTTNHFHFQSAFREVAKIHGYSDPEITQILNRHTYTQRKTLDPHIAEIAAMALNIRGLPHFLGQHPGGVLVTNQPIYRHVALEYSGGLKNRVITQIDMHNGIDELGLIKFDILGNGSLAVLRDTLAQLESQGLPDPGVYNINQCQTDPQVQNIISNGGGRGIFYIESPAQMRLNTKVRARTLEDVTITSSLVRPAAAQYTSVYVERERQKQEGLANWEYLHPSLKPLLGATHDVIVFQEDITRLCHHIAGLSYKQADKIRKMMNSLREGDLASSEMLSLQQAFINGCIQNKNFTQAQASELWSRVCSFKDFSFCKSHSASYAQLSFKCAYLKAHYPAQFLAAVLSNRHGFYTPDVYINEARYLGLTLLPPCINTSYSGYIGKNKTLLPGLSHIYGVSSHSIQKLIQERMQNGPFLSLSQLYHRSPLRKNELKNLILAGALHSFGNTAPALLYELAGLAQHTHSSAPDLWGTLPSTAAQPVPSTLSAMQTTSSMPSAAYLAHENQPPATAHSPYTFAHQCLNELHMLGYMVSANHLALLGLHPAARNTLPLKDLSSHAKKTVSVFGKAITSRLVQVARNGRTMQFLTLADQTHTADVILWPNIYEKFQHLLQGQGPFLIRGQVTEDWDSYSIEATSIQAYTWTPNQVNFEKINRVLKSSPAHHAAFHHSHAA